jgi:hypothetical protein
LTLARRALFLRLGAFAGLISRAMRGASLGSNLSPT